MYHAPPIKIGPRRRVPPRIEHAIGVRQIFDLAIPLRHNPERKTTSRWRSGLRPRGVRKRDVLPLKFKRPWVTVPGYVSPKRVRFFSASSLQIAGTRTGRQQAICCLNRSHKCIWYRLLDSRSRTIRPFSPVHGAEEEEAAPGAA